jgi:hypothetical protein
MASYKTGMVKWRWKWQNVDDKPTILIEALQNAKFDLYSKLLPAVKVLLIMTVTSPIAERSFSALKRIKPTFDQQW